MCAETKFNLQELDNYITKKCGGKEFFLGCWSADDHKFSTTAIPDYFDVQQGRNWIAIRNGAQQTEGLLFPVKEPGKPDVVIFRGYLAEHGIHSYSKADEVIDYWSGDLFRRHNGVFCAVRISENGEKLSIVTDIFGLCPVYIRKVGKLVFYSSTPALLGLREDRPDKMSLFMRLFNGYIPARGTLNEAVEIAVEASVTTYSSQGREIRAWYDYNNFPKKTRARDDSSLILSEKKLKQSLERCMNTWFGETILPLSSGYDSRRLFAHLENDAVPFSTCSARTLLESGEDVEAEYAMQIANDYNINCKLIELPSAADWYKQDLQRLYSMDGQCRDHTWSVAMFDYYNKKNCCFIEGTGGDVFGFNDWKFAEHLENATPVKIPKILKKNCFMDIDQIQKRMKSWRDAVPQGDNKNMLLFALWHTRKSTIAWAQQQARPGHLFLHPYFDLDYIEAMLLFANEKYVVDRPQQAILYKFWPELAKYRGTREMPQRANILLHRRIENYDFAKKKMLGEALGATISDQKVLSCFGFVAKMILHLSRLPLLNKLTFWWEKSAIEMILWWDNRPFVIELTEEE